MSDGQVYGDVEETVEDAQSRDDKAEHRGPRSGTLEKEVMPARENVNRLRNRYLVVPATLGGLTNLTVPDGNLPIEKGRAGTGSVRGWKTEKRFVPCARSGGNRQNPPGSQSGKASSGSCRRYARTIVCRRGFVDRRSVIAWTTS